MPTDRPRISLAVPEEQYQRIKNYQYDHRCRNQTEAVLELVTIGLETLLEQDEDEEEELVIVDARTQLMTDRYALLDDTDKTNLYNIAGALLLQDKYAGALDKKKLFL